MAWAAVQDSAGAMHFGCDTVVSFDGDRWRPEPVDPTYAIRSLDIGPNGRIWVAGVNQIGWLEPGAQGRMVYTSLMPRLSADLVDLGDVWKVYAEGDDRALFVTHERVLRWDGAKFTAWRYPGVRMLWSTRTAKSIYVHYPALGLLRIGGEGPSLVAPESVIGAAEVRWLDDSGEQLLLLTSDGFKTLRNGACGVLESESTQFARSNTPTCAARLGDGSIAVGTLKGGIAMVDRSGAILRIFNERAGLPANQIYSLFLDRDGALWAMGPSHIVRLAINSGVAVFGQRNGYPPGGCESVAEYRGSTYVASHSDILSLRAEEPSLGAGQFISLGISSSRFYSLLALPEGLLVGHFNGLGLWTGAGMRAPINSQDAVFRTSPSQAKPGAILVSQNDRVLSVDLGSGRSTVVADSLPDYGDTLADEPSGRLWIGTPSRGLFVAGMGTTRSMPAAPRYGSLPTSGPTLVSRAGSTIIALSEGAAYFLDARAAKFRRVSGFPGGTPSAVSGSDPQGAVWAALEPEAGGRSPRLGRIQLAGDEAVWTPKSIEGLSGIGSLLALRVVSGEGGDALWIAGSESLILASPAALNRHSPLRQPVIHAWARAEDSATSREIAGALPYSTRRLHIELSSLDYGGRESERFQTMLRGVDNEWSPPTDSADMDISGLREGAYDLRARLLSDSGETGEPSSLHFTISPPWWRTPLAYAAFGFSGAGALLGLIRLRVSSLRRRAQLLEDMVRQRTEELEKANAAKTEFVASMSHEIRNPMGGILGSAVELSETQLGPDQRALVSTIRNCASFLASLVEDVLDFAAIEAGAYKVARSPFRPREVLDAVVKMLESRADGARMDASVDPSLPDWLLGDAARIQQVIVNFATNSLKFGGKRVGLSARAEGEYVVFSVSDDGAGIPHDEQKSLFIRFSRIKSVRNSAIPGSGLGLAVSKMLAERMGGSVGVASAQGRGSTFFLHLPLEPGAEAAPLSGRFCANGARALVVEDIAYNARALGLMLGKLGFDVDFAVDGSAALGRLAAGSYRAVFLDCDLPGIGGVDVARSFRASEAPGRRTLIVATTALSTVEDQDACLAAGMDAFLAKPITPEKLRRVLEGQIGTVPPPAPEPNPDPGPVLNLEMIRHLSDGSTESLRLELAKFIASLDEAMLGVAGAMAWGSRPALASSAHRLLSHARMVGATALAESAADIQDYASVLTDTELAQDVATLGRRAAELRKVLESVAATTTPSR